MKEKERQKRDRALAKHSKRFHDQLSTPGNRVPTLFELMLFRMGRMRVRLLLDDSYRDYTYYSEHGWFSSDYFYPTDLGVLKRSAGGLFDWIGARMSEPRDEQE
jgi:hypothetical protein